MDSPRPQPEAPCADTAALIAIDWGTTSARAYLQDARGRVVGEKSAALGIQQVRAGAFASALAALLGDWTERTVPRIACGMIGSRQGWIDVAYHECPAALDVLAAALVQTPDGALAIVPGVRCVDAAGVPDVMRGEETQILGTIGPGGAPASGNPLVVLPGTHCKWARVTDGRIETFATFLTGELYAVLKEHSILGRMMAAVEEGAGVDPAAYERGVRRGLAAGASGPSLLHDLFGTRTLALFAELSPPAVADYLSGLLVGSEIREGRAWATQQGVATGRVTLVGAAGLTERYAKAFAVAGVAATIGPADAAARGLWQIAQRAGLVT